MVLLLRSGSSEFLSRFRVQSMTGLGRTYYCWTPSMTLFTREANGQHIVSTTTNTTFGRAGRGGCFRRGYRGEAGEGTAAPRSIYEQKLLVKAQPRYDSIWQRHVQLPTIQNVPASSLNVVTTESENSDINNDNAQLLDRIRRKRLIYRSKQRGWLEVDLLLGTFAHQYVPTMTLPELDDYEAFCNLETIDIYNIITLRIDVPEHLKAFRNGDNDTPPVMRSMAERIQQWARDSPLGVADPDTYRKVKEDRNMI